MADSKPRFIWYELVTSDQDAAEAFYRAVVGWKMADAGQPGMRYTILSAGGRGIGGMMAIPAEAARAGARPDPRPRHRGREGGRGHAPGAAPPQAAEVRRG